MKNLNELNLYRDNSDHVRALFGSVGNDCNGVFNVPFPRTGVLLKVIASTGLGWDHVSVSLPNRCPNWIEMDHIKRMFFRDDETAMQLHVPPDEHRNLAATCLHLWRPQTNDIPRPPNKLVGAGY